MERPGGPCWAGDAPDRGRCRRAGWGVRLGCPTRVQRAAGAPHACGRGGRRPAPVGSRAASPHRSNPAGDDRPAGHGDWLRRRLRQHPAVQRHGPGDLRQYAQRSAGQGTTAAELGTHAGRDKPAAGLPPAGQPGSVAGLPRGPGRPRRRGGRRAHVPAEPRPAARHRRRRTDPGGRIPGRHTPVGRSPRSGRRCGPVPPPVRPGRGLRGHRRRAGRRRGAPPIGGPPAGPPPSRGGRRHRAGGSRSLASRCQWRRLAASPEDWWRSTASRWTRRSGV
jgi:hypothetical protein